MSAGWLPIRRTMLSHNYAKGQEAFTTVLSPGGREGRGEGERGIQLRSHG